MGQAADPIHGSPQQRLGERETRGSKPQQRTDSGRCPSTARGDDRICLHTHHHHYWLRSRSTETRSRSAQGVRLRRIRRQRDQRRSSDSELDAPARPTQGPSDRGGRGCDGPASFTKESSTKPRPRIHPAAADSTLVRSTVLPSASATERLAEYRHPPSPEPTTRNRTGQRPATTDIYNNNVIPQGINSTRTTTRTRERYYIVGSPAQTNPAAIRPLMSASISPTHRGGQSNLLHGSVKGEVERKRYQERQHDEPGQPCCVTHVHVYVPATQPELHLESCDELEQHVAQLGDEERERQPVSPSSPAAATCTGGGAHGAYDGGGQDRDGVVF